MAAIIQIKPITDVPAEKRASAQPRDPVFYQNPYAFYDRLHASDPSFFWDEYGHWCFAGFKAVSALLRDKRFGREILHVASREELGMPEPKPHTAAFDLTEKHSLLTSNRPRIRGCAHWSTARSFRGMSNSCGRASSGWPMR